MVITKSFKTNTIDIQIKNADKLDIILNPPSIIFKVDGGDDSIDYQYASKYHYNSFELKEGTWTIPNRNFNQLLELIKNNYKLYVRLGGMYWINDYQFSLKGSAKAIQYLMGED